MKIIYCKYCGKAFETDGSFRRAGQITAHMRTCEFNPKRLANIEAQKRGSKTMNRKNAERKHKLAILNEQTRKDYKFRCKKCNKEFIISMTDRDYQKRQNNVKGYVRKYCDHCAHSIGGYAAKQFRKTNQISKSQRNKLKSGIVLIHGSNKCKTYYFQQCPICKKIFMQTTKSKFCSTTCKLEFRKNKSQYISIETRKKLSDAGKHSAAKQFEQKRSKCEIEFCMLCEKTFSIVYHNKPIFNGWDADILLPELKIAIQWNGPWHYKQISNKKGSSLASIQNRDNIKRKEIEKAGWSLYIIKDQDSHKNARKRAYFIKKHFNRFLNFIKTQTSQFYEEFELI